MKNSNATFVQTYFIYFCTITLKQVTNIFYVVHEATEINSIHAAHAGHHKYTT